ncbi:MAG TPA: Hsp20/alpha crystallin family protein [Syntrophorhabdaceae bacterium]|nr:Hsp20/alpha crystallin family protein [Syntrophorhabdaceae bacterium]
MARKQSTEVAKRESGRSLSAPWDLDRWFDDFFWKPFPIVGFPRPRALMEEISPSVDMYEEGGEIVLKAELPGMKKEDIDVKPMDSMITISGEKEKKEEVKKKDYYKWECSYGSFKRSFGLPAQVQSDKIKTKYRDGILEIRMPKTEEAKKKEVKVKVQ